VTATESKETPNTRGPSTQSSAFRGKARKARGKQPRSFAKAPKEFPSEKGRRVSLTVKRWAWKQPSLNESVTAQSPIRSRIPNMERDFQEFCRSGEELTLVAERSVKTNRFVVRVIHRDDFVGMSHEMTCFNQVRRMSPGCAARIDHCDVRRLLRARVANASRSMERRAIDQRPRSVRQNRQRVESGVCCATLSRRKA